MESTRAYLARARVQRRRIRARQRRNLYLTVGTAVTIALVAALSVASFANVDLAQATAGPAQSFLDLMKQRSPGERTEAALAQIKHHRVLAERESSPTKIPGLTPKSIAEILAPPEAEAPDLHATPLAALAAPAMPAELVFQSPPVGVIPGLPGGSIETPCCGGPPQQPPETPPQAPAVPEPGTWAMMILGFGLTGWAMRRARAAALPA